MGGPDRAIDLPAQGLEPNDARRIGDAAPGPTGARDVYVYFDNDAKVRAPVDARSLRARVAAITRLNRENPG